MFEFTKFMNFIIKIVWFICAHKCSTNYMRCSLFHIVPKSKTGLYSSIFIFNVGSNFHFSKLCRIMNKFSLALVHFVESVCYPTKFSRLKLSLPCNYVHLIFIMKTSDVILLLFLCIYRSHSTIYTLSWYSSGDVVTITVGPTGTYTSIPTAVQVATNQLNANITVTQVVVALEATTFLGPYGMNLSSMTRGILTIEVSDQDWSAVVTSSVTSAMMINGWRNW